MHDVAPSEVKLSNFTRFVCTAVKCVTRRTAQWPEKRCILARD
ncbi:hypothetical protein BMF35_a2196 [Aurantiacibacter gangjinensis]|nr:hypothetical protein BMF35_a2196 [Aurantiacibacter gangjinensis]